jgi:predicted enzyme related to lactoylglutathione lyase
VYLEALLGIDLCSPGVSHFVHHQPAIHMQRVTGIGGLFFRAENPVAVARWYEEHLGIELAPPDYSHKPWSQEAGPTVFAPFPKDSEYFGNADCKWMINFRVKDLNAIVEQLRAAKIEVSVDAENYPNGRFARLRDPEGNPIELWEPK